MNHDNRKLDANRDPLTGAVVGGLAEKGVAEAIDPAREYAYWSENISPTN